MFYQAIKPLLFRVDPELAHDWSHRALQTASALPGLLPLLFQGAAPPDCLAQRHFGVDFPGPMGLAAGFDKLGASVGAMGQMGFGFAEVGTVTPLPQAGNPKPRLFRYPEARTLQNAMGFNNAGMEAMASRLEAYRGRKRRIPVAVNVGKNKATPLEDSHEDYRVLFRRLNQLCDFFVINVSSPNTPGLRALQDAETVRCLVELGLAESDRPILVKLAPDLSLEDMVSIAAEASSAGAAGLVLSNTTTDYSLLPEALDFGGLSGRVLKQRSFEILRQVARAVPRETILISVGGIDSAEEVFRRLKAGAHLVEIYSALVFEGPGLIGRLNRELVSLMEREGVTNIKEVVGVDI